MSQSAWRVVIGTLILAFASLSHGLDVSYCSSDNTAGSFGGIYDQFMSNGYCQDQCQGSYVFAVVQGSYCWCSNYIPAEQVNTITCNEPCPGFGSEWCGSTSAGLYSYFDLGGNPLGTAGAGGSSLVTPISTTQQLVSTTLSTPGTTSPAPSSTTPSTTSSYVTPTLFTSSSSITAMVTVVPPQSTVQTRTSTVPITSSTVPIAVSSASKSSTTISTTSSTIVIVTTPVMTIPSPTLTQTSAVPSTIPSSVVPLTPSAVPSTIVTTVTGIVKTILVTPSASATADPTLGEGSKNNGGGVSTGKVVGIVLGVALGLGLIIGLGVFFWLRKKHANNMRGLTPDGSSYRETSSAPSGPIPSRQVSQLSSSNLLTRGVSVQTKGLGPSNTTRSAETASSGIDRRSMGTDQRLNPNALYIHDEGRFSDLSLQDNHDYSRQLRVANPDP